jgi:hypothetical protein
MRRATYNASSLRGALAELERRYGMPSEEFHARHIAGDELDVPRFDRHLWLSYYLELERAGAEEDGLVAQTGRVLEPAC